MCGTGGHEFLQIHRIQGAAAAADGDAADVDVDDGSAVIADVDAVVALDSVAAELFDKEQMGLVPSVLLSATTTGSTG